VRVNVQAHAEQRGKRPGERAYRRIAGRR